MTAKRKKYTYKVQLKRELGGKLPNCFISLRKEKGGGINGNTTSLTRVKLKRVTSTRLDVKEEDYCRAQCDNNIRWEGESKEKSEYHKNDKNDKKIKREQL